MLNKKFLTLTALFLLAAVFFISPLMAQVTIGFNGTPSQNALLDLKQNAGGTSTKGLLLPRVALQSTSLSSPMSTHETGLFVYNTATINDVTPGIYYNDGTRWIMTGAGSDNSIFFYMPAFLLPVDTSDPAYNSGSQTFTINLHAEYAKQFGLTQPASSVKNPSATTLPVYANSELDYFITYFDSAVFSNVAVTNTGVMTYKLVSSPVFSEKTFMNIVFQVK